MKRLSWALLALAFWGCRPQAGNDAFLQQRIDSLAHLVSQLRQEPFRAPVQGRWIAREDLLDVYDSTNFEEPDPADSAWTRLLWAFGFTDSVAQLDAQTDSVDESSIMAFYARGTMYVVRELADSSDELNATIAHELIHALQDQRWDLEKLYRTQRGMDRRLALQYQLEGEARLFEGVFAGGIHPDTLLAWNPDQPLAAFRDSLSSGDGLEPEFVTIPTFHAYEQGAHALAWRYKHGGWTAVDDWLRKPPGRTSCYLQAQRPCVDLGTLSMEPLEVWGREWSVIHQGRLGQTWLDILLTRWQKQAGDTAAATTVGRLLDGYRDDAYQLMEGDSGSIGLGWHTVWATEEDASNFLELWRRILPLRRTEDQLRKVRTGEQVLAWDPVARVWDRAVRVGRDVFVLEGISESLPPRLRSVEP